MKDEHDDETEDLFGGSGSGVEIVRIPTPGNLICRECLNTRTHELPDYSGYVTFCGHSGFGGTYGLATGLWAIHGPFTEGEEQYVRMMANTVR